MEYAVSLSSMICMGVTMLISICVPIGLFIYFRRAKKADILPFFTGCGVMFLFALVLEAICHQLVFASSAGTVILNNQLLYALYGGAMAGLFEETGRLIAFRTVLRRRNGKDANALMYGAGHGGFEAIVLVGVTMIGNLILCLQLNAGGETALLSDLPADAAAQMETAIATLRDTPSYAFLLSGVERISAIALHISFSVLVWFAAKKKGAFRLYFVAVFLHFLVDAVVALLSGYSFPLLLTELVVLILSAVSVLIAVAVWRNSSGAANPELTTSGDSLAANPDITE